MDNQFYRPAPAGNRRSPKMETASLILGAIAFASICLVYPTLICGSLAIVFALLGRGGEVTFSPRAKAGLALGCAALSIILFLLYTIVFANLYYGGLEEMMREMYSAMGVDYDALFDSFY